MKKYDVIIVDVHNLYHRNYHVYKNREEFRIKRGKGILETGGIHGSLVSIRKLKKERLKEDGHFFFVADNSTSVFERREEIDPDYKSSRQKKKDSFYKSIDYLISILQNFVTGDKIVRVEGFEADDIAPVAIKIEDPKKTKDILVVSTDMDWSRLMNYQGHNVEWFDGKNVMSEDLFEEKYGFPPSERGIIIYKAFRGDKSDFIPAGVKGIPSKIIDKLLDEKSVDEILRNINLYDMPTKWTEKIIQASARIRLNEALVDFLPIEMETVLINTQRCKYNKSVVKGLLDNLNLSYSLHPTLAKDVQGSGKDFLESWDKPIKRNRA